MNTKGIQVLPESRLFLCDSVLFDLDGTLVDTSADLWAALGDTLAYSRLPQIDYQVFLDSLHFGIEGSIRHILHRLSSVPEATETLTILYKHRYAQINHRNSRLYAGVPKLLSEFKSAGLKLGICTNKESNFTLDLIAKLSISHYFDVVVGIDQIVEPKPAPEALTHAMALMGVSAHQSIFIGDSHLDAQASAAAGVPFLLHTGGYGTRSDMPNTVAAQFESFAQLLCTQSTSRLSR